MGAILHDWQKIVGDKIASLTCPQKLVFRNDKRTGGMLSLLAATGSGPLIQQISPMILERINTYFGYNAVANLKIQQGFLPPKPQEETTSEIPSSEIIAWVDQNVNHVENEVLKSALQGLGQSLMNSQATKNLEKISE